MPNREVYELKETVERFAVQSHLQKPEQTVFDMFQSSFANMTILDIGVGGGRTTCHFAPVAKKYVAIDYAENMIQACDQRFGEVYQRACFEVCDVRDMSRFEDDYFDVICAFNSLDHVADLETTLTEIASERTSTIVFPFPMKLGEMLTGLGFRSGNDGDGGGGATTEEDDNPFDSE